MSLWAEKYGFTPEEVKSEFDKWAAAVEDTDDYRTIGLREFYKKNFQRAAENFDKAAQQGEERAAALQKEVTQNALKTFENWKLSGNSLTELYRFEDALKRYENAEKHISVNDFPEEWYDITLLIGNTHLSIGIRSDSARIHRHLNAALESYNQVAQVYPRERDAARWAAAQLSIGNALNEQGIRTSGEAGAALLSQSVAAYRQALLVYTRDQLPQQWAMTQNNLGGALKDQGIRTGGEAGAALLSQSVAAYRQPCLFIPAINCRNSGQ